MFNLVLETFGLYSRKTLELLTHSELPWIETRVGIPDNYPSSECISKELISTYFSKLNTTYNFHTKEEINKYIRMCLLITFSSI